MLRQKPGMWPGMRGKSRRNNNDSGKAQRPGVANIKTFCSIRLLKRESKETGSEFFSDPVFVLIYAVNFESVAFQCFNDFGDMLMTVGFGGYFQLYMLYAVDGLKLVVFQLDDIGTMIGQNLGDA